MRLRSGDIATTSSRSPAIGGGCGAARLLRRRGAPGCASRRRLVVRALADRLAHRRRQRLGVRHDGRPSAALLARRLHRRHLRRARRRLHLLDRRRRSPSAVRLTALRRRLPEAPVSAARPTRRAAAAAASCRRRRRSLARRGAVAPAAAGAIMPMTSPTLTVSPDGEALLGEHARRRRRQRHRDLVGLEVDHRLVDGDRLADLLEPLARSPLRRSTRRAWESPDQP